MARAATLNVSPSAHLTKNDNLLEADGRAALILDSGAAHRSNTTPVASSVIKVDQLQESRSAEEASENETSIEPTSGRGAGSRLSEPV